MFESRISAGGTDNLPFSENLSISSWSYDNGKVMPRNVWDNIESWQTRRLNNSTRYLFHAMMTIIFKAEEMKSVGELSSTCSQIVLKCLYLARIGRPDILWSVNNTRTIDYRMNQGP